MKTCFAPDQKMCHVIMNGTLFSYMQWVVPILPFFHTTSNRYPIIYCMLKLAFSLEITCKYLRPVIFVKTYAYVSKIFTEDIVPMSG